ncbi:GNAT family N-acetyltransferase [Gellertiella hungarica]|uniref:RimJ/RimL family protein N-acetyltransferase n=1 Tax=Gellertiella hungarica TaxID=1572859 RepID=A0A7W6J7V9_9HYPH|nr:GNAT family N-acetyltransferase [Gellertiella hungarica]MBB4065496.1 RimJ/RimL family protein N-acetyltransferase [Gellertiella hungarica]
MSTPVIETERMRLRVVAPGDLERYVALWQDETVLRYTIGAALTRETGWSRILRTTGHWQVFGFGFFVVEDRQTGEFVGEAGFHDMKRQMTPSIEGTLETGWMLLPHRQGQGLALEVMTAAMDWAARAFPHLEMTAIIDPENQPSRRLAARLGFVETVHTEYAGHATIICRMPETPRDAPHSGPSYPPRN